MRVITAVQRPVLAPGQLDPQVFCHHLEAQHFPDFGFHQVMSAFYEPWEGDDYLVHATLRHRFNRKQHRQTLIARPCGEDGAHFFRAAREMWAKVYCRTESLGMARPLGFLPDQGLLLQFLPDGPTLASLMQQRREKPLLQGIRTYARWLAKLHASRRSLEAPHIRLDRDASDALLQAKQTIVRFRPDHEAAVSEVVASLDGFLRHQRNPHIPTLGHHRLQDVVFHEDVVSPLYFNEVALGDPAADIGGMIGNLYMTALKYCGAYEAAEPLIQAFTSEYRRHGDRVQPTRTEPHQAYAIVLQAAQSLSEGGFDALRIGMWLDKARALV